MNIQIFGKAKCFDTKKAERYFKERRVKYQYVDVLRFGMSRGELSSVKNAVGLAALADPKDQDYPLFIDISKYGMSKGEYNSVKNAVGGMRNLIDEKSKAYEENYCAYLADEDAVEQKLLENPVMFRTPIVRSGKKATVGYCPDVWKTWE